jgi:hypothetical protein
VKSLREDGWEDFLREEGGLRVGLRRREERELAAVMGLTESERRRKTERRTRKKIEEIMIANQRMVVA